MPKGILFSGSTIVNGHSHPHLSAAVQADQGYAEAKQASREARLAVRLLKTFAASCADD